MILAKPLTLSDRTIIREFATLKKKQQAVVLPKDFMRSLGFEYKEYGKGFELPLHLRLYGPGSQPEIDKPGARISRHSKDWRIDQCIIRENEYPSERFSSIEKDDIFLVKVDVEGGTGVAVFLAKHDKADSEVIAALGNLVGLKSGFSSAQLLNTLEGSIVSPDHVIWSIFEGESGDDLSLAGGLAAKGSGTCSPDQLKKRLVEAERIGFEGEKLFARWLATKPLLNGKVVESFEWISQDNATSPYDFVAHLSGGTHIYVEVKTTTQSFNRDFYISAGELAQMVENTVSLARIYSLDTDPAMRICDKTVDVALQILQGVELMDGAKALTFSASPELFAFLEETQLSGELQGQLF